MPIIWQIQTGSVLPSPVDPVVPEGQDPSLTEDALEAAFALLSSRVAPPSFEPASYINQRRNKLACYAINWPLCGAR